MARIFRSVDYQSPNDAMNHDNNYYDAPEVSPSHLPEIRPTLPPSTLPEAAAQTGGLHPLQSNYLPAASPPSFVKPRWDSLVSTNYTNGPQETRTKRSICCLPGLTLMLGAIWLATIVGFGVALGYAIKFKNQVPGNTKVIDLPPLNPQVNYKINYNCEDRNARQDTVNISTSSQGWDISTFDLTCGQDLSGGNMVNITAYTFDACLRACAAYNYDPDRGNKVTGPPAPGSCMAVVFNPDISTCVRVNNGNCYLKNDTYTPYMVTDHNMAIVAAVLQAP